VHKVKSKYEIQIEISGGEVIFYSILNSSYRNKEKVSKIKNDLIFELSNNLSADLPRIAVSELYSEVLGKTEKNEYKGIKFVKKQNKNEVEYVIANNQVLEGEFKEKTRNTIIDPKNKQEKSILFDDLKYKWRIENGSFKLDHPKLNTYMEINKISKEVGITKLSDFILTVVDTVRKVSPTTNNPASSRSHLLIYIEIPSTDNTESKYLIFGDLAGVENKFTCEDTNTQIRFFEIKNEDRDPSLKDTEEGNESYYTTSNTLKYTPITPEKGDNLSEFNDHHFMLLWRNKITVSLFFRIGYNSLGLKNIILYYII
jgi:hypothetical protein